MFKHELGVLAESKTTGIKGIIMSRSECLYGCNRYSIQPKSDDKLKLPDSWWFDEDDLKIVGKGVTVVKKPTGGLPSRKM